LFDVQPATGVNTLEEIGWTPEGFASFAGSGLGRRRVQRGNKRPKTRNFRTLQKGLFRGSRFPLMHIRLAKRGGSRYLGSRRKEDGGGGGRGKKRWNGVFEGEDLQESEKEAQR